MNGEHHDSRPAVEVTLSGGASVRVRLADDGADGISSAGREAKLDLEKALAQVGEVAAIVRRKLEPLAPTKATVEFGVSFSVQSGRLTSVVFEGRGDASLTVSLEWQREAGGSGMTPVGT